ncbi:MAG TPA: glycerophosphodiester phosphodiesterase family protein [Edaphobacter sp.]|nr:glycerophosphodiester phosphodiesterase family protein [Edaphobacter sp.]
MKLIAIALLLLTAQQAPMPTNPYITLMTAARAHAFTHGVKVAPVLSPEDKILLGDHPELDVAELHRAGFRVIPWNPNDQEVIRTLIRHRVDGIISDRPDVLQTVLGEERAANPADAAYFASFDVAGHRGARGLRPENTLPAFEAGLDHLITTIETDTGVTTDNVSLIWHDQFLSPQSCRGADGTPYTLANRIYTRDISSHEAQKTFICDKLHSDHFPDQRNDLALSPVAVTFAAHEHLINPYVPTYVEQLFRFTRFYVDYYRTGPGKSHPDAALRAANAAKVRFNIETKILPLPNDPLSRSVAALPVPHGEPTHNHTVDPQTFVTVLCGAIQRNHMESRTEVQSFDFRTLQLVEEQYPNIPTYYLTETTDTLSSPLLPVSLRQP